MKRSVKPDSAVGVILRAYKVELDPTPRQVRLLKRYCGAARRVWNWAKATDDEHKQRTGKHMPWAEMSRVFTQWKCQPENQWLGEVPDKAAREPITHYANSLSAAYERINKGERTGSPRNPFGFPVFHKKRHGQGSFVARGSIHVESRRVKLPGASQGENVGWIRLKERNYLPISGARVLRGVVSERAGRWFLALIAEVPAPEAQEPLVDALGADLGVKSLAAVHDASTEGAGKVYENPKALRRYERKLARLQREFSRRHCVKGHNHFRGQPPCSVNVRNPGEPMSANASKTQAKIARLHYRIACIRQNASHQATHDIIFHQRPAVLVIEDLNVKGMVQNGRLAKAVHDANMAEVKRQLIYKGGWAGVDVQQVDRWFPSSKVCPSCGAVKKVLRLSERTYRCDGCGYTEDRDLKAAISLAQAAKQADCQNACGGGGSGATSVA